MTPLVPWWLLPTVVTVLAFCTSFVWYDDDDDWSRLLVMIALVPALLVSCVAWIIAGALK